MWALNNITTTQFRTFTISPPRFKVPQAGLSPCVSPDPSGTLECQLSPHLFEFARAYVMLPRPFNASLTRYFVVWIFITHNPIDTC